MWSWSWGKTSAWAMAVTKQTRPLILLLYTNKHADKGGELIYLPTYDK